METNHIYGKPEGNPEMNVTCPLCGFGMEEIAGLALCTNTLCPNHKGIAS